MLNRKLIILGVMCLSFLSVSACAGKKDEESKKAAEVPEIQETPEDFEYLYHDALSGETLEKDEKTSVQKEYKVERGEFRKSISEIAEIVYEDLYYANIESDEAENMKILVAEGDKVKKGDVLATYNAVYNEVDIAELTRDVERMENEYQAEYAEKKAEINMAEHELGELKGSKEKEIKRLQIKKLKIMLDKFEDTKDSIVKAREELDDTVRRNAITSVTAEHDGYVLEVSDEKLKDNQNYIKGDCIVTITQKKKYHIQISSRENVSGLKYGSDVTIIVEGMNGEKDVTMKGKVMAAPNILDARYYFGSTDVSIIDEPEGVNWNNPIKVRYDGVYIEDALLVPAGAVMTEKQGG
ncbi:MAG: hypothetical protein K2K09_08165, partial [Lachnospiraceae bacterium]|nr:hypothetical protein [Lachnospiraceae bacterium]